MTSNTITHLLSAPIYQEHDPGRWHPERPERLSSIISRLETEWLITRMSSVEPRAVTREELERVHEPLMIDRVMDARGKVISLDPDTQTSPMSVDAAELAAGGGIELVRKVLTEGGNGLALVRPPGHHATRDTSMGFCLFNNVAVAAADALASHAVERILVVDWDVHHGNGTQAIFYDDPRVLYFSVHQYPHYPGTGFYTEIGSGDARGTSLNVPMPAGTQSKDVIDAFDRILMPAAARFQPDMILVSAGFDGHRRDPLSGWLLEDHTYRILAATVSDLAEAHCDGRWVVFLEGGYDLQATAASMEQVVRVLLGQGTDDAPRGGDSSPSAQDALTEAADALREFL